MASTRCSDEQLDFFASRDGELNGERRSGPGLCDVASLRLAINKAIEFAAVGRGVVALMRRRIPLIVVLSDQVRMLANRPALSQGSSGRRVAAAVNETNDGFGGVPSVLIETSTIYLEAVV
jgi:hypothetical protein